MFSIRKVILTFLIEKTHYIFIPINSNIIPAITPILYKIPTILKFSFNPLLILNNTANPTPAPVNSPAIKLDTDITFSKYMFVKITDAAQFGIRPINPAIIGPIIGLFNNIFAIFIPIYI